MMLRRVFLMALAGLPVATLAAPPAEASWVSQGVNATGRGLRRAGRSINRGVRRGGRRVRRQIFGRPRRRRR
jgi:hypothetical protein